MPSTEEFEHLRIPLEPIKSATNDFNDDNIIGKGGFGKVYKGERFHFKGQNLDVAVKRLDPAYGQGQPEFWNEISMLTRYRHENIVSLLGFCDESNEKILVYEYLCKKSLDLHLSSTDLSWKQRLLICIGVASGIEHLHNPRETNHRLLHRDIKSSNILLDKNWTAKISDFGLSKLGLANQGISYLFSNVAGTPGYCDPEYEKSGLLTKESDIYSFGVVLYEVLCGRSCFENYDDIRQFPKLAQKCFEEKKVETIIHDSIKKQISTDCLDKFTAIAYRCLQKDHKDRPLIAEIIKELEVAYEYQEKYESEKEMKMGSHIVSDSNSYENQEKKAVGQGSNKKEEKYEFEKEMKVRSHMVSDSNSYAYWERKAMRQLESLPSMVAGVRSNNTNMQKEATSQFYKLLSIEPSPPIEKVIQSGVVPHFVEFLMREDSPELQLEAAWLLAKIANGTSKSRTVLIDHGAVPIFVKVLASRSSHDVREQACWALGFVAADSVGYRDLVLDQGALMPLLSQLSEHANLSMLRAATWTLIQFCGGKPPPPFGKTKPALQALERLVHSNDERVLENASWVLFYLSDGTNDRIQAVIDAGVCKRLVELLLHLSPSVVIPALRTVGSIVRGDYVHVQHIIEHGALPCLLSLLTHNDEKIKEEACWTISNITAGNKAHIQAVIEAGLIAPVVNVFQTAEFDINRFAAYAICNATTHGTSEQIKYLVSQGCIKPLCDLLVCTDLETVTISLKGLAKILVAGEEEKKAGNTGDVNLYAKSIDDAKGLEKIENLQNHDNNEIREKACNICNKYFRYEEDDELVDDGSKSGSSYTQ